MSAIIPQKTCSKCKQDKPASTEYFPVRRASKDGLGYQCHVCNRAKSNEWREIDPERARETDKRKYDKQKVKRESSQVYDYIYPLTEKTCSKCNLIFLATTEHFHIRRASKDGLSPLCKQCNANRVREWREAHPDKYAAYNERTQQHQCDKKRAWRKANPEKARQQKNESQKRNRDGANVRSRRFAQRNPERRNELSRASYHRRVAREGTVFIAVNNHKRRALKLMNGGTHTKEDIERLYEEQERRCFYCGISLHGEYHVDHIYPLSRGGSNAPDNLACTCAICNLSKGAKTLDEWKITRGW